ncbi:unnamed protein product [Candidula unifasciata]|uniref:sphingomyelin phosphodiesterase n=1 Tax=Candidula unifasciata TaxID=100452 RepID=A0A8S3YNX3_9EUPU|nr:unnamed protein product [Candidula unifasciata]
MSYLFGSLLSIYSLTFVRAMLYPSYVTFNWLLCLYISTLDEARHPVKVLLKKLLLTPVYVTLFILCLPLLLVFLPIRCFLVNYRQPFLYSEKHTSFTKRQAEIIRDVLTRGDYRFGIASANLCLMPELASKMNNLINVDGRAEKIGDRITVSQFFNDSWSKMELWWRKKHQNCDSLSERTYSKEKGVRSSNIPPADPVEVIGDVTTSFPLLDFMVIQEAWSSYHNKLLIDRLHKMFPYIVHDVGVHSFRNNNFVLNSGLLLASKHPIAAVNFKPYNNFIKHGKILSLGLLMVKVIVGRPKSSNRRVGYIFNTHLQSYQGKEPVIPKQLDEIYDWTKEFVQRNTELGDKILFELLCGDFNFDNLSPADAESTRHRLFNEYVDVCRLSPGCDKPWTVGTEMRQDHMFDSLVTSPDGLKSALEDPALRQCHIIDGDIMEHTKEALAFGHIRRDDQNNVVLFPEGGRRRIDYIIYHKSHPVNVEAFHFVTQLASLTDHIPVAMEFTCPGVD